MPSCLLKGHQQALRGESTKVITTSLCKAERESKLEKLRDRYHHRSTANPMPACGLSGLPDAKRRWVPQDKLSRGSVRSWMVPHMKIHSYELLAIQLALFRTVVLFSKEKTARWAHQTNLPSQGLLPNPLIPGSPRPEQLHHKHCLIFIKNP